MRYLTLSLAAALLLAAVACNNTPNTPASLLDLPPQARMVGEWQASSFTIKATSVNGKADSNVVVTVTPNDWEKKLGYQPIRTTYRADGSYEAVTRNTRDSIIATPNGKWRMMNDSTLELQQIDPHPDTMLYRVQFTALGATFSRRYDYDKDGAKDDFFEGVQQRITPVSTTPKPKN